MTFGDTEYKVYSENAETYKNWFPMSLLGEEFEMNKQLYVSPGGKYIMLFNPQKSEEGKEDAVYWVGPCGNVGELKEALKDFGFEL